VFKVRIQDPEFGAHELQGEVETKLKAAFGESWLDHVVFNAEVGARFSVIYTGDKTAPSKVAEALAGIDGVKVEEGREDRELVVKFPGLAAQVQQRDRCGDGRPGVRGAERGRCRPEGRRSRSGFRARCRSSRRSP
jgi:hypothetical protein